MESTEATFPEADVEKELNPAANQKVEVDPVSAEVATSLQIKEQIDAADKQKAKEKKDGLETLKSGIIVSGIAIAVAGAVFAIVKKLKEK
ncbi:OLC1v1034187C1 [Oldenlandia corymbosa var. corymbosa]|uniref:OLC1v1034187C1 n=1 Tax=Oldenlandia corymbosa var. corymbosa TaxID=529605 RepID=A0AAV1CQU4_OLDCO|nr:OLC1v1034187C1 [Oldenlandia corymbosa var. corymbosa]